MDGFEKIRWAPKAEQAKIRQLYLNDARGTVDEAVLDDVGFALLLRCRSVIMVSKGQVECPRCGQVFIASDTVQIHCPLAGCGWQTSQQQYHNSWRHQDLHGCGALPAFQSFSARFEQAASARARMLLIDQLIHAFHANLKYPVAHRSAASNLIEGTHRQVVAFLDALAYGTPDLEATHTAWQATMHQMQRLRGSDKQDRCTENGDEGRA